MFINKTPNGSLTGTMLQVGPYSFSVKPDELCTHLLMEVLLYSLSICMNCVFTVC